MHPQSRGTRRREQSVARSGRKQEAVKWRRKSNMRHKNGAGGEGKLDARKTVDELMEKRDDRLVGRSLNKENS